MSSFVNIFFEVSFKCENRRVVQVKTHQMVQKIKNRNQISDIQSRFFCTHVRENIRNLQKKLKNFLHSFCSNSEHFYHFIKKIESF